MYTYYIGENTDWINKISHCLNCQVITFNNPIKTILSINERSKKDISPTYIFIESYNKKRDLQWLNAIAQGNPKNTYLLLLSEKIAKEDIVDYLHAGTSEIVNINTTPEDLQTTLAFLPKIKQHTTAHVQNNPRRFKLPWWKRTFDIFFSGTAIVCLSPFLIVTALAIRIESKGPIIYKSKRVGSNYDIFDFLKFRSMYADAEERKKELMAQNEMNGLMFKMENDPRITKTGDFLRKTSLDEFPQFINILKGDMSLVGTRPPTLDEFAQYSPYHKKRLSFRPGLTGMWQVSGRSDITDFEEIVKLDVEYIDNWSFWLDIKILLKTFLEVFTQKGAR